MTTFEFHSRVAQNESESDSQNKKANNLLFFVRVKSTKILFLFFYAPKQTTKSQKSLWSPHRNAPHSSASTPKLEINIHHPKQWTLNNFMRTCLAIKLKRMHIRTKRDSQTHTYSPVLLLPAKPSRLFWHPKKNKNVLPHKSAFQAYQA